jgi:uncharacterized protein involved in exopolysaccharide biosynthesis
MNETKAFAVETQTKAGANSIAVIDVLIALADRKKLIIGLPIAAAILASAISLAVPNLYKSSTKLLPPQQAQSGAAALLSQLGGAAGMVAGAAGIKNPNDLYMGMLRSRTVVDKLISKFDLKKAYDVELLEKARQELTENTIISSGKDGIIEITVIDEDKKRAAQLANSYVAELQTLTQGLALTEASQRRAFFQRQLELAKNNLAAAEMTLKASLDANGVISVDSDSRAIVETVSRVRAQIAAKEIELRAMQSFVTPNNEDYKRVQEQIRSLRAEYDRLQNGSNSPQDEQTPNNKGQVGLGNIKTLREVKYQQMLYEMLAKQYEVARLDEAKDAPVIQVLDVAIEAERKFKPARAIIVGLSSVLGFFAAIAIALLSQAKESAMCNPEQRAKWQKLKSSLRIR